MKKSLKEIAALVNGELIGNGDILIGSVNGIREAQEGDITFLANPLYGPLLAKTNASAVITSRDIVSSVKPIIRTADPSLAFTKIISLFRPAEENSLPKGIDKLAVIGKDAKLGKNISVAAFVVIEQGAEIGDGAVIYPHVYVGHNAKIGRHAKLYPGVVVREGCVVGERVIIHSNSVVGSDGFGYVKVNNAHQKILQTGIVLIGDDVEIGSNVSIDRARFGRTIIGKGTKIDNLVQIAHNVIIGENTIIVSQAGISGSARIGNNVILAGQSGVVGHVQIGDNVIVAAQAGVTKSVPPDTAVLGSPANNISEQKRIFACLHRLPELFKIVKEIKDRI
ncbi:MAG: UDP-3-O-(3-hydroxymyristoyl)glucosamine N-acyltransferase [Candidatus Omnitrophica bacterium]|jgi:UDP-3-O-[3-hydroxymyristoyl] glucosamine N-acyltransferase|nr:UDP-3-O-(3-hydroxymyristoyl)glucosamine N-acyltransferase [Candidatus Omnitrophota bacterium]